MFFFIKTQWYTGFMEKEMMQFNKIVQSDNKYNRFVLIAMRLSIALLLICVFLPGANPARISELINRNISLFTSGFIYKTVVADMGRLLDRGWIDEFSMIILFYSSLVTCLGIFTSSAGAVFSVGNNKCKRTGFALHGIGLILVIMGLLGIYYSYTDLLANSDISRSKPLEPTSIWFLLTVSLLSLITLILAFKTTAKPEKEEKYYIEPSMELFLLLLPFVALVFIFSYLPLWGWRYAFFDYKPGGSLSLDKFVGFKWFTFIFETPSTGRDLLRALRNTLGMSGLGLATSWVAMVFAIFLSEMKSVRFRRIVQTLTTIPNFISWVLVYAVAFSIFSTEGFISSLMVNWGFWTEGQNMLMGGDDIWFKMLGWGIWKGLGWGAIMYLAAITSIDQQLYEAATVDGAGRFQKMWHITVPELIPTYMVLLLLAIAGILNNGMEQYLVFENPTNTQSITVLDLYVFKLGIGQGLIPLSTVVGMVKSIVSVFLLFMANGISKMVRGSSIV
jgi:putative aldouronate transport system permease protein